MLRDIIFAAAASLLRYATYPLLRGFLEILISPRSDILLIFILFLFIAFEVQRCSRFFS